MLEHLRHRWALRAALVLLAGALAWSHWSADAGLNTFVGMWAAVVILGALGATFPGWAAIDVRVNRLPLPVQAVATGLTLGAFGVVAAQGSAPFTTVGLLFAIPAVYADVLRSAWRALSRSAAAEPPASARRNG